MSTLLRKAIQNFEHGHDLDSASVEPFFDELIREGDPDVLYSLLKAWSAKGFTEDELYALAKLMRRRMKRVSRPAVCVDIVGTGGSRFKTFNVSTAAAFVTAGAGIPVAKHGNRAATSSSGSADVLERLGIAVSLAPAQAAECLDSVGIAFLFAPAFHSLSRPLAVARRSLAVPTIFNYLGPLCNPASVEHAVVGVAEKSSLRIVASVLHRLGMRRSWVVNAEDGLDEIALNGATTIVEVTPSGCVETTITRRDMGLNGSDRQLPRGCSVEMSCAIIRRVLSGEAIGEPVEEIVLMNAAAATYLSGKYATLQESFAMAQNSIRSGAAAKKLQALAEATNR